MIKTINKHFRVDEICARRLAELAEQLGENESEILRVSVQSMFDFYSAMKADAEGKDGTTLKIKQQQLTDYIKERMQKK